MRSAITVLLTLLLLAASAPMGTAHRAADPPDHMTRLLHDCNDDYFGGDGLGGSPPGHDLHALDIREAWNTQGLGDVLVFRVILLGDDPGQIDLTFEVGGATHTMTWGSSGGTMWAAVAGFSQVNVLSDIGDGDRIAIEGVVSRDALGLDVGDVLSGYALTGRSQAQERDHVPGYDGSIVGSCTENFERASYKLAGPVQYATLAAEIPDGPLLVGTERFLSLSIANLDSTTVQSVTLASAGHPSVDVRFHDPGSGGYSDEAEVALAKKGESGSTNLIHLAATALDYEVSGTLQVVMTTDKGGRVTASIPFETETMEDDPATETTETTDPPATSGPPEQDPPGNDETGNPDSDDTSDADTEDSPSIPFVTALLALFVLVARRRR